MNKYCSKDQAFPDSLVFNSANELEENVANYEIISTCTSIDILELRDQVLGTVIPLLKGYIWQRSAFCPRVSTDGSAPWRRSPKSGKDSRESKTVYLWGQLAFGDNIEDEWFLVSLLKRVTREMPGVGARVWDNDGEFLLIEAAYSLPRWLKPETSANRVFLYGGEVHIVPLPSGKHPTLPPSPTVDEALGIVASDAVRTEAPAGVQAAIDARLGSYPEGAAGMMHSARVRLPARCAAALAAEPLAIGPAVEAFYARGPDDMKAAAAQIRFPPVDIVTVLCRFNRCLYAQLQGQTWEPPKGYPMPPVDSPAHKAASLGAKVVAGMEILLAREAASGGGGGGSGPDGLCGPARPPGCGGSWTASAE
uniref:Protein sgt1 n=1 Tax=Tetraselmis sp. GSL018 TaxID=582737 RepID=A0A061QTT0_9CHLO